MCHGEGICCHGAGFLDISGAPPEYNWANRSLLIGPEGLAFGPDGYLYVSIRSFFVPPPPPVRAACTLFVVASAHVARLRLVHDQPAHAHSLQYCRSPAEHAWLPGGGSGLWTH